MSSSGIPANSTLTRTPKVLVDRKIRDRNGNIKKTKATVPAHQLSSCNHTDIVYTQSVKGVPSNLFRNSGAKFSATLEQKAFYKLENMCMKVNLQITGGAATTAYNLAIPTYWFNRHEYRAMNGSKHLNIVYNDNLHLALATVDPIHLEAYARLMGMTVTDNVFTQGPAFTTDGSGNANVEVFIPILGSWVDSGDLFWKSIDGDMVIDFHPNANIRGVQGDTYQVDCTGLEFVIQTEALTDEDVRTQTKFHDSVASETSFLDVTPVNFYNQTVTASSTLKLELDALNGEFAFLAVYIRDLNADASSNPRTALNSIGPLGRIDILDPGSKSIIGSGTGISERYLKNFIVPRHFKNRLLENTDVLIVPFGGNCANAYSGVKDGCLHLDGSRYYLSLTPDSSFTTASYDITVYGFKYATLFNGMGRLAISD